MLLMNPEPWDKPIHQLTHLVLLTPTPIGAKCEGAEAAFGLTNTSTKLKVNFSKYDSNSNSQNATFEIPVN